MKASEKKLLKDTRDLYNAIKLALPVSDDLRDLYQILDDRFSAMSETAQESEKGEKLTKDMESIEFIADGMDALIEHLDDLTSQFDDILEVES